MLVRFIFTETAKNDLVHLSKEVLDRIGRKLRQFEGREDTLSQLKKLTENPSAEFRLRIGDYRLLMDKKGDTLYVLRVRHRREAYR